MRGMKERGRQTFYAWKDNGIKYEYERAYEMCAVAGERYIKREPFLP